MSLPGFDWRIDSIARTEPEQLRAARALGDAGCDVVAHTGTPFVWGGLNSLGEAQARQDRLADAAGVPVVMAGIAIVEAFAALGVERVALVCTYYSDDWMGRWARFVRASGLDVVAAQNLAGQGLMPSHGDDNRDYWAPSAQQICASVRRLADEAPAAQAIAISGAGSRTLSLIGALEGETERPIFGSDTALYRALAIAAGVRLKPGILGAITNA